MKRRAFFARILGGLAGLRAGLALGKVHTTDSPSTGYEHQGSDYLVKVLGTAQDGGIPQIGCFCTNCRRARQDPRFARLVVSLALLDLKRNKAWLIDATPDLKKQYDMIHARLRREKEGKRNIPDGVLLTHAHMGHYTGLMFYGYESLSAQNLPVFCSQRMGRYLSQNGPWSQLVQMKNITLQILDFQAPLVLGEDLSIQVFQVPHRDEFSDTLGLIIRGPEKSLLYIPDIQSWETWTSSIAEKLAGIDIALLDGTFFGPEELPGRDLSKIGHPLMTTTLDTLKGVLKSRDKQIYFTHLNHSNLTLDPQGEARRTVIEAGCDIAADGMEFFL